MESINRFDSTWPRFHLGILLALSGFLHGCSGTPQFADDPDCFKTVDALYTAIGSRNLQLVDTCAVKLNSLKSAGKLFPAAHEKLQVIIETAKKKDWRPAAEQLSALIKAQRVTAPSR